MNMTTPELLQLGSMLVALAAVVIGPTISLHVAKRQIDASRATADLQARANVLSKNRQDWINTLRTEIAGFLTSATMVLPYLVSQQEPMEMYRLLSQMRLHLAKTQLLINPNEKDHAVLVEKMQEMLDRVLSLNNRLEDLNNELVSVSQGILKREWERVKAFS